MVLVKMYKVVLNVINGISSTEAVHGATLRLLRETIKDVRFIDDELLMLASCTEC